jgi:hypothetical protein
VVCAGGWSLQIKAQGLLNAAKWIEAEYGRDGLRDVLHACSPAVRDRYTSVIAIDWHPVEEFTELVSCAERVLGGGHTPGRIAESIGAAGARANMKSTLVRLAAWVSRPEALMQRATGLWRQFNDDGLMEMREVGDHHAVLELTGLTGVDPLFCAVITGWCREVGLLIGAIAPIAKHVECKHRAGARCVWEVRYARVEPTGDHGERPYRP